MGLFNFKSKSDNEAKLYGVAFTCKHCLQENKGVTYIGQNDKGDFECFCDNCGPDLDLNSVMLVGKSELSNILNQDMLNIIENSKGKYLYLSENGITEIEYNEEKEYIDWLRNIEEKIIGVNISRNKDLRSDISGIKIER